MRFQAFLIFVFFAFALPLTGQGKPERLDLRIGSGISILGTGDMVTFNYENEINYKLNSYFTSSFSINLGRSNYGVFEMTSFTQGNFNFFFSPFRNNRLFDFRIGTGLTYYGISDAKEQASYYENGVLVDIDYTFENRNAFGYNMIIENSFLLTNRLLIGTKLFSQPYSNGDINSGIIFKLGFKI